MTTATSATPATSVTTTNANGTQSSSDALNQLSGNFDTFLQLLTTQLQNQDPTAPMDSNTFTQELVEFSQVEQQINTNTNLNTLISQGTSQAGVTASSYLGKTVTVTNGNASLLNSTANWNYTLGTQASSNTLTITNSSGQVIYTGAGETGAGSHSFSWDGEDNNGNQLPDGVYTLAAAATTANGSAVTTSVSSSGQVTEIDMSSGTPQLVIGNMEIGLSQVANVQ